MEIEWESDGSVNQVMSILQRSPSSSRSPSPSRSLPGAKGSSHLLRDLTPMQLRLMLNWTVHPIGVAGYPGNKCRWPGCRSRSWTEGEHNKGYAFLGCWELMKRHLERHVHDHRDVMCPWPACGNPWATGDKSLMVHTVLHVKRRRCMVRSCHLQLKSDQIQDDPFLLAHIRDQHSNVTLDGCWPLAAPVSIIGLADLPTRSINLKSLPGCLTLTPYAMTMAMAIAPTVRPASMRDHSPGSQALDDTPRGYAWLNNSPTPLKPTKRRNVTKATTGPELCTVSFEPKYRDSRRKQYDEARVGSLRGKTIGWESWSKRLVATSDAMDMEE